MTTNKKFANDQTWKFGSEKFEYIPRFFRYSKGIKLSLNERRIRSSDTLGEPPFANKRPLLSGAVIDARRDAITAPPAADLVIRRGG